MFDRVHAPFDYRADVRTGWLESVDEQTAQRRGGGGGKRWTPDRRPRPST